MKKALINCAYFFCGAVLLLIMATSIAFLDTLEQWLLNLFFVMTACVASVALTKSFVPMAKVIVSFMAILLVVVFGESTLEFFQQKELISSLNNDTIILSGLVWMGPFFVYTGIRLLSVSPQREALRRTYRRYFKITSRCFYAMYSVYFLSVFLFNRLIAGYSNPYTPERDYNLIPFRTVQRFTNILGNRMAFDNLVGNVLFFLPLGFFFLILWPKKKWYHGLLVGACISLFIEITQFIFNLGTADIDDLLLNVLGMMLGFLIKKLLDWIRLKRTHGQEASIFPTNTSNQ